MEDYTSPYDDRPMREQTVGSVLANRASRLDDKPYMFYGPEDRAVSFAETNRVANAVANALRSAGIEPGQRVSVLMRNPLETMFAMFGINKAGAVYSPINYDYQGAVLSYQINDTEPDLVVVEDRYVARLNEIRDELSLHPTIAVYETDADSEPLDDTFDRLAYNELKAGDAASPDVDVSWHDTASIVYTSGTTGQPKGVVLPHRWIFGNYVYPSMPSEDAVSHNPLPLYHVGGLYASAVSALASGSAVALWDRYSPTEFWDRVEKYEATSAVLISVMMAWLMKQPERDDDRRNTVQFVSMNPLPDNYKAIARRFGFDFIGAGFGQTESGNPLGGLIHAAKGEYATPVDIRKMDPDEVVADAEERGRPVVDDIPARGYMGTPNTDYVDVTVLDENDEEVPPGETGELAIRPNYPGILMTGYYNKPEATVDAFRNLWFHTGDAVYRDRDDNYFFVDRMGDVIRRRGENISSMQIQAAMNSHDAVAQSAAFPVPAEEGGEDEIGIAVEPATDDGISETEARAHLESTLPEFMVPKYVMVVDRIPSTETNKMEKYKVRARLIEQELGTA